MDSATFAEYLKDRYQDQLDYYESESNKNRKRYKFSQWTIIILSTLTTILAALPHSDKFDLKYVVVAAAALVTILTSVLKTFQYQELWVTYRKTVEQLRPERFYYNFKVGDYGQRGIDKETLFVKRVESILNNEREAWPLLKQQMDDELTKKMDEDAEEE